MYLPVLLLCCTWVVLRANEDAKRLFDDLLRDYNKLRRPVEHPNDKIIDVHEKNQIMTTSVWLKQEWIDKKLSWDSENYGGVDVLYVPAEMIWVPDLVLYNNADSNYNITITTKATVHANGTVEWEPPAIYKSMCQINVQWFPFDVQVLALVVKTLYRRIQDCHLKFGSWTYDWRLLDLLHMDGNVSVIEEEGEDNVRENVSVVWRGVDLDDYYPSVEWEILEIPSKRHNRHYQSCCPDQDRYVDITYYITLRRKPLFYTVNLIFPCVGISFLTILVFYLPSDSGEKVSLSISILVSLTVFFLLLTEIIPATSIVLPLIGKYLLFTMIMVTLSVMVTVVALNLHFRTPTTHRMPRWVKRVFLQILPPYIFMRRPMGEDDSFRRVATQPQRMSVSCNDVAATDANGKPRQKRAQSKHWPQGETPLGDDLVKQPYHRLSDDVARQRNELEALYRSPLVLQAFENVCFIAELLKKQDKDDRIDEDWKYVAMVVDRLFLWIFSITCFFGTLIIILQAPTFRDDRVPIIGN